MTIALDQAIRQKLMIFDEFLACYGSDNRYELIDGESPNIGLQTTQD